MRYLFTILFFSAFLSLHAQTPISTARTMALGSTVTIQGTLTCSQELGARIRYVQDGSAGIAIYGALNQLDAFVAGDVVEVTGTLKDYQNLLELDPITSITRVGTTAVPAPITFANAALGYTEQYEGQLVLIEDVQFTATGSFSTSSTNYNVTQAGNTYQVRIMNTSNIAGTPIPSGIISIVGEMSQYSTTYQLLPRSLSDFILPGNPPVFTTNLIQSNIAQTSFDVSFNTLSAGDTKVHYGLTPTLEIGTISDATQTTNHMVTLPSLQPGTIYYVQGESQNTSGGTSTSAIQTMATASASTGRINVYFNSPVNNSVAIINPAIATTDFTDTIINYINAAQLTLDIAIYNISNTAIINAINAASARGVVVRLIADSGVNVTGFNALSIGTNNKKKSPTGTAPNGDFYGIMHNKFVIVDADAADPNVPIVIAGSTNFTDDQLNVDRNNLIIVQDQSLARSYKIEFNEMWSGTFGPMKTMNTPQNFLIGGKKVELHFSPTDLTHEAIINTANSCDVEAEFGVLTFTRTDIAYALKDQVTQGQAVYGIIDDTSDASSQQVTAILVPAMGNYLRVDGTLQPGLFHSKYLIVDQSDASSNPTVLTGSHNWSTAARYRNDENTLVFFDQDIANQYYQSFVQSYTDLGGVVGISTVSDPKFNVISVYPNPSRNVFNIALNLKEKSNVNIDVLSVTGQTIYSKKLNDKLGFVVETLDLTQATNGIYFIRLSDAQGATTSKVIKF